MPSNQINPFDYNIDNFDSGFLGPISDTNFRNWVFSHNLPVVNPVIGGVISNAWGDRGTEYDVSQSNPNVVDVPNLTDVANTPSLYNNMTNPRQDNLSRNIPGVNPEVASLGITNQDLGVDASTLLNSIPSNVDLPSVGDVATIAGPLNNFTNPTQDNLAKNPSAAEMGLWHPEMISIIQQAGNSLNTSYGVPATLKIGYAGNVESWVSPGGYTTTTFEIRDAGYFTQDNKYGPSEIVGYSVNGDDLINGTTGFIQYNDQVQGDFRDQLFSRTLGVGVVPFSQVSSGINYKPDGTNPSELDLIARKRRGIELANRLKLNFTDDVVGAINTSVFDLAAGGSLVRKNYQITVPKTNLGKAAQFVATLAGFELPTSIIPSDAFVTSSPMNPSGTEVDISNQLLDYTGAGQKSLLFSALDINKYGPTLGDAYQPAPDGSQVKKSIVGAGQPPQTYNYLSEPKPNTTRQTTVIDDINNKVSSAIRGAQNTPQIPTEFDNPTIAPDQNGGFYGRFEQFESVGRSFSEKNGFPTGNETEIHDLSKPNTTYIGTPTEILRQGAVSDETVDWRTRGTRNPYKKGILKYTQDLVNKSKLGDAAGYIGYFDSADSLKSTEYKQDIDKHGHLTGAKDPTSKPTLPSKGNTTRNYSFGDNVDSDSGGEYYCRSWSSRRKYHTWDNLIRSEGNWWRVDKDKSNLMTMNWGHESTGMPKIAWDSYDNEVYGLAQDVVNANPGKKFGKGWGFDVSNAGMVGLMVPYMFSIENLAWKDSPNHQALPPCEKGPNGGRIMWFPPYNMDFSDSTSANWDSTNFIGRGEPIYTYNHTERTGQLSFTIVVDHPSVLNELKNRFKDTLLDEGYHSFFAGCDAGTIKNLFKDYIPENSVIKPKEEPVESKPEPIKPKEPKEPPYNNLKIYFENTRTAEGIYAPPNGVGRTPDFKYEVTYSAIAGDWANSPICSGSLGLNAGIEQKLQELAKFLVTEDGKNYTIKVEGFTSSANPTANFNTVLAKNRADNTKTYLYNLMVAAETQPPKLGGTDEYYPAETSLVNDNNRWVTKSTPNLSAGVRKCSPNKQCFNKITNEYDCCDGNPCDVTLEEPQANSKSAKEARYATITLVSNKILQANILNKVNQQNQSVFEAEQKVKAKQRQEAAELAAKYYINECDYFQEIKRDNPFVYASLGEKIQNFHPAFHAITPEGFNSRLTFLQQCMRQGPQLMDSELPQNMVFGRPPICVLKIGDFYHTKIVVDSMNFTFDPLQWDLNPEGIGVQPMLVKVDMGFKFIGGSSLGGPIKQLQNAVSYNFFANTGIYQPAQVLDNKLEGRRKFIYGAFKTPEEANKAYDEVALAGSQTKDDLNKTVPSNPNTTNAAADPNVTAQMETDAPTTEAPASQGETSPPSPPPNSVGAKLTQVGIPFASANPNSSSEQYYLKLSGGSYLGIKIDDPNGYKPSNKGILQFKKDGNVIPYGGSGGQAIVIEGLPSGNLTMELDYLFNGTPTNLTLNITI